ncbi:hypothetical protein [Rheinheimera baltica]|uniref:hypothetical protein n=1 Tax=Rheinheimera baltica TaxID=67576 RepID=UPI0003FF5BC9|nr:hypothetical protein [Rheinheimera baltica]
MVGIIANKVEIDTVPDALPKHLQSFLKEAMSLPIDATDAQVKAVFPSSPKVSNIVESRFFKLNTKDALFSISKHAGCIFEIDLVANDDEMISVWHRSHAPSSGTSSQNQPENSCQYSERTGQKIIYYKNGIISPEAKHVGVLPKAVSKLFTDFQKFNYRRDNLYKVIGTPISQENQLLWRIEDVEIGQISVSVETEKNCEKSLSISWKSLTGEHQLVKENSYNTES